MAGSSSRRSFVLGATALGLGLTARRASGAQLDDSGLYHEPWFIESLMELNDDAAAAATSGKRFVILWELRGCPYCRDTHLINFARPDIADYVKTHFDVLQLNLVGAREVTDFDGEKLSEKRLAQKYGVMFTPTFQFFDEAVADLGRRPARDREATRAQGYMKPDEFVGLFRYVVERAYRTETLRDYLRART